MITVLLFGMVATVIVSGRYSVGGRVRWSNHPEPPRRPEREH